MFGDFENLTKSNDSSSIAADIVLDRASSQVIIDDDELQDEEGAESVEQGEPQPLPPKGTRPPRQLDGEVLSPLDADGPRTSRSGRTPTQSSRYSSSYYLIVIDEGEPKNFKEAQAHTEKKK